MKTVEPIIVSSLSEASEADVVDGALAVISAPDASAETGYTTKKSLLSRIKDYIIGKTSISGIGDGTVTGAISSLNSDLAKKQSLPYSIFQNRVTLTMAFAYKITDRFVFVYFKGTANQALQSNTIIQGLPVPTFAQGFMCNIGGAYAEIRANATDGILMYGVPNGATFAFGGVYAI